jgi:hypothetical protein
MFVLGPFCASAARMWSCSVIGTVFLVCRCLFSLFDNMVHVTYFTCLAADAGCCEGRVLISDLGPRQGVLLVLQISLIDCQEGCPPDGCPRGLRVSRNLQECICLNCFKTGADPISRGK